MFTVKDIIRPDHNAMTAGELAAAVTSHDYATGALTIAPGVVIAYNGYDYALYYYKHATRELISWVSEKSPGRSSTAPGMLGTHALALVKTARKLSKGQGITKGQPVATIEAPKRTPKFARTTTTPTVIKEEVKPVKNVSKPVNEAIEVPTDGAVIRTVDTGEGLSMKERAARLAPAIIETLNACDLPAYLRLSHYDASNQVYLSVSVNELVPVVIDGSGVVYQIKGVEPVKLRPGKLSIDARYALERMRPAKKMVNRKVAVLEPVGMIEVSALAVA
ncbi:hypothetical protein E4U03_04705 [Rothia nasimurium]|uniref:Uncharacterized protein n=1 Tax=Rothia nasimurium TaxID=85336 RepID=A0A4Y9F4H4_9MICC|nr:hypothetical protein [Rothia nasimurium]MBF0807918.1 hypothetical protein [Rothia nasimurium]TFU22920.1 hypothetical protein E4U03_04705 [Rothia nasimurium]